MAEEKSFLDGKTIAIAVLAIAVAGLLYLNYGGVSGKMSGDEAATAALGFINTQMLQGQAPAVLDGATTEEHGVYKINIKVGENSFPSYVTKDGKLLFPQVIEVKESTTTAADVQTPATAKTCEEVQKQETPLLEAFVVSYCPYGLQMQRVLLEIMKNVPGLQGAIKILYMGAVADGKITAMHGDKEAQENLRQICVREEQNDKFVAYLACFIKADKSADCLKSAKVDEAALKTCMETPEKGLAYAQADFDKQKQYKVEGSPSLFLNGLKVSEFDFGGRTAQAVKGLTCCGFTTQPEACATELSSEQAVPSFSETYTQAGGTATGTGAASCDQ